MERTGVALRMLLMGFVLLTSATTHALSPLFRKARTYVLQTTGLPDSAPLVVADVTSSSGAPDGIADILTADLDEHVVIRVGNRDGSFSSAPNIDIGTIASALAVAPFDADGIADLLVADATSVTFLRGSGSRPAFQGPGVVVADHLPSPTALAAIDLNGDEKMDAVVVNAGNQATGSVVVLLGNGDGSFAVQPLVATTGGASSAVALGDFNGDGKVDLAVTNESTNNVTVLHGDGHGGLDQPQTVVVGQDPVGIAAGDLNGDGRTDLVVVDRGADNIAVLLNMPDHTFAVRFYASGSAQSDPRGVALADVNKDGNLDVLVGNKLSGDASVLLGDGQGSFGSPRAFTADQDVLAIASTDVNDDGIPDAITVNQGTQGTGSVAVLLGQANGALAGVENLITTAVPTAMAAGDVDNDGICDLAVAQSGGAIPVYRSGAGDGFVPVTTVQLQGDAAAVAFADFNGDGAVDLVALNASANAAAVFLAKGSGGFGDAQTYTVGNGPTGMVVGDWNGDERPDLAVAVQGSAGPGAVDVLIAAADGTLGSPATFPAGPDPLAVTAGDFNHDGRRDLVVANGGTPSSKPPVAPSLSILFGDGHGSFAAGPSIALSDTPVAVGVADFDGDGFDDIAVAGSTSVLVFFGDGQGGFPAQTTPPGGATSPVSVLAARDVSGDSFADLLVPDNASNAVDIFVSGGAARQLQDDSVTIRRVQETVGILSADFSGGGRYDVAAASTFGSGGVSILTNVGASPVVRGDGNSDGVVSAADAIAVARKLGDSYGSRAEDAGKGAYAAGIGVDANGDGVVTPQDTLAVIHRIFEGSV